MFFQKSIALFSLSFVALCHAKGAMKQVESVDHSALASQGWTIANELPGEHELTLQIGLTYQNQDQLINTLLDVSNPKSQRYGKWLKKQQVEDLVKPSKGANDAVVKWLASEGITKIASDGTWVTFKTDVATANRVMNADFKKYERFGVKKVRTTSYSVPEDILQHVDIIHPTTFFGKTEAQNPINHPRRLIRRESPPPASGSPSPVASTPPKAAAPPPPKSPLPKIPVPSPVPKSSSLPKSPSPPPPKLPRVPKASDTSPPAKPTPYFKVDASCREGITPDCIRQMYNVGNYTPTSLSGSKVAFSSFLNQSAIFADLVLYQKAFGIANQTWDKVFITPDAANSQNPADALKFASEANLDVQNIMAVAHGLPVIEFLTGGKPPFIPDLEMKTDADNTNEPYVPYYQFLLEQDDAELPQVISNSYGEPEHTVPYRYALRTCTMAAQLTLRGITILESSGDTGIGSYCLSNDGLKRPRFIPEFPSSCPWITSVGGTESVSPEIAWRDSSGGFSDYFQRPAFQWDAVSTFFSDHFPRDLRTKWRTYFNEGGRAFPDISAHSLYPEYLIVYGKEMSGGGGTSAASPVIAAIIGLLNDARLRNNLPVLGFINPLLYTYADDFLVDIKSGKTQGCHGRNEQTGKAVPGGAIIPGAGWAATVGWDAATGLGVPDFQKMLKVLGDSEDDD